MRISDWSSDVCSSDLIAQHRDVARARIELFLGTEELQRALRALVIVETELAAQRDQLVAAIFGEPHHAALVERIARRGTVAQHRERPAQHRQERKSVV